MPEVIARAPVVIDYPKEDEAITSPYYTFRLSVAPEAVKVEFSIDQADWRPCRPSVGYWWFDWAGFGPGDHEAAARVHLRDGRIHKTASRSFRVAAAKDDQNDARAGLRKHGARAGGEQ